MTRQMHCKVVGGTIVARETKDSPRSALDGDGNPVWRPYEDTAAPSIDAATQVRTSSDVIEAGRVVKVWAVRDKTAEELAADKQRLADGLVRDRALGKALFHIANEARAAGGKPAISAAQFKSWLVSLL